MKKPIFVVAALLLSAPARSEECKAELDAWQRAVERVNAAKQKLADYDGSPLAPVVPGQAEKERQQLQDNVAAAQADVDRTSKEHTKCLERPPCKKWKGGWACTVARTYEKCCIDKGKSR